MQRERSRLLRPAIVFVMLAVLTLGSLLPTPAPASARIARPERKLARHLNDYRTGHGVRRLDLSGRLSALAERHSARMARRNLIFHSADIACAGRTAEVVGSGDGWGGAFRNLRLSSPHRTIMLRSYWQRMGVGVRRSSDNGLTYVTISFCG